MPFSRIVVLIALLAILPAACVGIETQVSPPPAAPLPGTQPASSPASGPQPVASPSSTAGPQSGAVPSTPAGSPPGAAPTTAAGAPVIVLVRSGGFAGRTDRWTLSGDGRIATVQGTKQAATPDQVAALLSDIQALGFFKLNDQYGALSQCRDCYNYEMTVAAAGQTKTVRWVGEASDTPPALAQILARFNKLITPAQ